MRIATTTTTKTTATTYEADGSENVNVFKRTTHDYKEVNIIQFIVIVFFQVIAELFSNESIAFMTKIAVAMIVLANIISIAILLLALMHSTMNIHIIMNASHII